MKQRNIGFDELCEAVLNQLKSQGYMDSTLTVYRRFYNRVHAFIDERGPDIYSEEVGREFLNTLHVSDITFSSYKCAIRRLNDFINDRPYRCHHDNPSEGVLEIYEDVLNAYLERCGNAGNKPYTISVKKNTCVRFLNYIAQAGCSSLLSLNTGLISQALLIYDNKDHYAIIRSFLGYLADNGLTQKDFSGIVPRHKRRKVLPTTYTPEEIYKIEDSVDTSTDTGKRNLAIIRLATRMGFRSGDIAKLRHSEVDFDTGYIRIIQEKTGQPLSLEMPQAVSKALLSHLENTKVLPNDDFIFHSMSAPYGRITTSIIRHVVNEGFIAAGVCIDGKKHGPHSFRSSLASSMVNDGASYETVRKILGHTDPNVIKHYAKTDIENLRSCAIAPPVPSGLFSDYLSGKKVISHV